MIKKMSVIACSLMILTVTAAQAAYAALPEIDGWSNGELRVTKLDTVSGNHGTWEERDYLTPGGERYHAVWIEGSGEKGWLPAEASADKTSGLLASGAVYQYVEVLGQKAVYEDQQIIGKSLTVKIEKQGTLTLETQNTEETALFDAGMKLIAEILEK